MRWKGCELGCRRSFSVPSAEGTSLIPLQVGDRFKGDPSQRILFSGRCWDSLRMHKHKQETWVQSLGGKYPLEKGNVTHLSILAWRIPWSLGSQRIRHDGGKNTNFQTYKQVIEVVKVYLV